MLEYLYAIYPHMNWEGLICFLLFISGVGLYQWGVARGEELAEQKREQEQRVNRYRW